MPMQPIKCPCGIDSEGTFVGSTTKADEYGSVTQMSWSHRDHYFYLVVRAPFRPSGYGGEFEITLTHPGIDNKLSSNDPRTLAR